MTVRSLPKISVASAMIVLCSWVSAAQDQAAKLTVHWDQVIRISQTTPTLQVVVNPALARSSFRGRARGHERGPTRLRGSDYRFPAPG
jgi:hypothetical protein